MKMQEGRSFGSRSSWILHRDPVAAVASASLFLISSHARKTLLLLVDPKDESSR
jgi:hypothetical protein